MGLASFGYTYYVQVDLFPWMNTAKEVKDDSTRILFLLLLPVHLCWLGKERKKAN